MINDKIQGKMYGLLQIDNIQEAVKNEENKNLF